MSLLRWLLCSLLGGHIYSEWRRVTWINESASWGGRGLGDVDQRRAGVTVLPPLRDGLPAAVGFVTVETLPPLFEEAVLDGDERWLTVILGDLLPEWGEGATEAEAIKDLVGSIWSLHDELHDYLDANLAPHLRYQRDFLCGLSRSFGKHP